MVKAFILFLVFESTASTVGVHHIEFASRQSCEAAKTALQAKAKQQTRPGEDGKKAETLKLIDAACLEK